MNPGTEGGGLLTHVGNDNLFMVGAHVAHDCRVGNHIVMANNATLGGHVTLGDYVIVGGLAAVHQFVRVGAHAIIGGLSAVVADVIPFGLAKGERAHLAGLNIVGLERRGFSRDDVRALRSAYRMLFAPEDTFAERVEETATNIKIRRKSAASSSSSARRPIARSASRKATKTNYRTEAACPETPSRWWFPRSPPPARCRAAYRRHGPV